MTKGKAGTAASRISTVELKSLLTLIAENNSSVSFRYRLLTQMWHECFLQVLKVTEKGVFLKNEKTSKIICIKDLAMIVQFELDSQLLDFQPNYHYDVLPENG